MMARRLYTPEEHAFLAEAIPAGSFDSVAEGFSARFRPITRDQVRSYASNHHIPVGERRHVPTIWDEERDEWMREFVPGHEEPEIIDAFEERFGVRLTVGQVANRKNTLGVKSGTHGGRFKPGDGHGGFKDEAHRQAFIEAGRRTRYKHGNISGKALADHKPIGYEYTDKKGGYVHVKVKDGLQVDGPNTNFRFKHHLVWEEANGRPVPKGCVIAFGDHDRTNIVPENLVCVPRSVWAVLRHMGLPFSNAEELRTCMVIAQIKSKARRLDLDNRTCSTCGRAYKARYDHQANCDECIAKRKEGRRG